MLILIIISTKNKNFIYNDRFLINILSVTLYLLLLSDNNKLLYEDIYTQSSLKTKRR